MIDCNNTRENIFRELISRKPSAHGASAIVNNHCAIVLQLSRGTESHGAHVHGESTELIGCSGFGRRRGGRSGALVMGSRARAHPGHAGDTNIGDDRLTKTKWIQNDTSTTPAELSVDEEYSASPLAETIGIEYKEGKNKSSGENGTENNGIGTG